VRISPTAVATSSHGGHPPGRGDHRGGPGADLLIIEATLPRPSDRVRGHLTPEEAGEHAKHAGAKRVVITHISDELGDDWAREEAERGFGGEVEVAREGASYEV
jgi:ribonuclease BN (tRNA processing enzyme)